MLLSTEIIRKILEAQRKEITEHFIHERKLIGMVEEEKLKYVGSIVLGLNDALEYSGISFLNELLPPRSHISLYNLK